MTAPLRASAPPSPLGTLDASPVTTAAAAAAASSASAPPPHPRPRALLMLLKGWLGHWVRNLRHYVVLVY